MYQTDMLTIGSLGTVQTSLYYNDLKLKTDPHSRLTQTLLPIHLKLPSQLAVLIGKRKSCDDDDKD